MTTTTWGKNRSNSVLNGGGFYISYNHRASQRHEIGILAALLSGDESMMDATEETALYDGVTWRILKGDFRSEYEAAFPDLDKCLAVYEKHKKAHRSSWSTD